jgi:cellulose synthase/poly-beta-1,6-N-acetylglucosamine synthase-like glycosyltransferase
MSDVGTALSYLFSRSQEGLASVFLYSILFDAPRYGLAFLAEAVVSWRRWPGQENARNGANYHRAMVIVAGHNEAGSLERCVRSLRDQSAADLQIVAVSDGSTDETASVAARLVREGLLDRALSTDLRAGKAAAVNLAIRFSTRPFIVNVDCDCSFDRFAVERLLERFDDPTVGAVCGDIAPRNGDASLAARFQEIEYLLTISVGKRSAGSLEQVVCASGAFSAFRRAALETIDGLDVGGGEDLDLTLRLRARGWRIAFADDAICYTDVPTGLWTLIRQRRRWERDAVWLRFRKHRRSMDSQNPRFRLSEAYHQWEFLTFNVGAALIFPIYLIWIFRTYGTFAVPALFAIQIGLFVLDIAILALADSIVRRGAFWRNILYLFGYSVFASYIMRTVRLIAYTEEWLLSRSRTDNYVPQKVRAVRRW